MDKKIGVIIGFVVVAGVFFYGGMTYGQRNRANTVQLGSAAMGFQPGAGNGTRGTRMGRAGGVPGGFGDAGGLVVGEVLSKDNTSVTIQTTGGGSKIVYFSSSTRIMATSAGTLSDVLVGKSLMVTGSANTDGSVTAQSIQIRPASSTFSR